MRTVLPFALLVAALVPAVAQNPSVTSPVVGYTTVTALPNSDTIVGVPFIRGIDAVGQVDGTVTQNGAAATLNVSGVTFTSGAFADSHYVRFSSGTLNGHFFRIISNTTNQIVLDTEGDILAGVLAQGDAFDVIPFWTLETLLPPETQTTIQPSASMSLGTRRSSLLFPDVSGSGINRAASNIFYLHDNNGNPVWRNAVGHGEAGDLKIWPDSYFIIRHPSSVASSTGFLVSGTVDLGDLTVPVATSSTSKTDNYVSIPRPVDLRLDQLGLMPGDAFVGSLGISLGVRRDELLVFNNELQGLNKSASAIFYYDSNAGYWRNAVGGLNSNGIVIPAGAGLVVRKAPSDGQTRFWTNVPSY